jgi:dolichol-phosphate mannosyltransferase
MSETSSAPAVAVAVDVVRVGAAASDVNAPVRADRARPQLRHMLSSSHGLGQMARFAVVGSVGYVVNLVVYTIVLNAAKAPYLLAAVLAFLVAFGVNFVANRHWTFAATKARATPQAARFLIVSLAALGLNLVLLKLFAGALDSKTLAQALAVAIAAPFSFIANRFWTFADR